MMTTGWKRLLSTCFAWALLTAMLPASAAVRETTAILVNKSLSLPEDYVPSDLVYPDVRFAPGVMDERKQMRAEAARALERMFAAALEEGIELIAVSGYRSFRTQNAIYHRRLSEMGATYAARYIAKPGFSEHQTGLAMDLGCPQCTDLTERFCETQAYAWLAAHVAEYGFIIRYPDGGEEDTGYAFEPWHVRYLGEEAQAVFQSGLTYEAYLARKYADLTWYSVLRRLFPQDGREP